MYGYIRCHFSYLVGLFTTSYPVSGQALYHSTTRHHNQKYRFNQL